MIDRCPRVYFEDDMRSSTTKALLFLVFAATIGCDKNLGEDTSESDTGESESTDTGSALICAEFTSQADCNAQGNDEIVCQWAMLDRAVRTGDSCEVTEVGFCLQQELFGETNAGCGVLSGCEDSMYISPYYKVTPEGVLLLDTCGGTSEPGFAECPTGEASADNPPECACACALAP
jgi:hypothetical protein